MPNYQEDQFPDHGRIPIKPLPYENNALAQKSEFMIDYTGDNPKYHLYIVDPSTEAIIDITAYMVREAFGDSITVPIDGIEDPISLHDLMNFIYKRFAYADKPNGFEYAEDYPKVIGPDARTVLLRDVDGIYYLPVTSTDSVFDHYGVSLQERLSSFTRLGFSNAYVTADEDDQQYFDITYPYPNYDDFMELRIGTVYVDKSRYEIINPRETEDGIVGATIHFFNDKIESGRRIDILFIYNTTDIRDRNMTVVGGNNIALQSIPINRLEKVSDEYTNQDSTSVATSKAVYSLYKLMSDASGAFNGKMLFAIDSEISGTHSVNINFASPNAIGQDPVLINIYTNCGKTGRVTFNINYGGNGIRFEDVELPRPVGTHRLLKILVSVVPNTIKIVGCSQLRSRSNNYFYRCLDQETRISFEGLAYDENCTIKVYRNGVRLFENLDYSMNTTINSITLYNRTEEGEYIVFEAEYLEEY